MKKILLPLALVWALSPAFASNVSFLEDAAIGKMGEADIQLFLATLQETLDQQADGESRVWENPETQAGGSMTPLATFEQDGTTCRRLGLANRAQGVVGESEFLFCRQPDGSWKMPARRPAGESKGR
jgi:surface antigen